MNLKVTNAIPLSIGGSSVANVICTIKQYAYTNESGGMTVPCDLKWWLSVADMEAGKDQVWPIKATITPIDGNKITNIAVELTQEEAMAAGMPVLIWQKVAEKLVAENVGWTVVFEL